MKKSLVAVATIAALGAATIPVAAEAHDAAGPIIAGAVIGAVIGTAIASSHPAPVVVHPAPPPVVYAPAPVVYAPPPRVVYAPPPRVVYVQPAPRVVYSPVRYVYRFNDHRGWHDHDGRGDDRRDRH